MQVPTNSIDSESSPIKGITRTTFVISIVSMLNDIANEMVVPLLPLFVVVGLGASVANVGVIEGVASALSSLFVILPGLWSDRSGRRMPFIFTGYAVSAASRVLLLVAGGWWIILSARAADRFGKSIRSAARDALIADSAPEETHGRNFGFFNGIDTLGSLIGPLLASGILFLLPGNFRLLFALTLIPSIGLLGFLLLVKERPGIPQPNKRFTFSHFKALPRSFFLVLTALTIFSLSATSDAFLILRAEQLGLAMPLIPIAYAMTSLTGTLLGYPAGLLADRIVHFPVLVAGMSIHVLGYLGFGFAHFVGALSVWPLFLFYGFVVLVSVSAKPLLFGCVPKEMRGTASGLTTMCGGVAALLGNSVGGVIWTVWGATTLFLVCSGIAILAVVLLVIFKPPAKAIAYL